MRINFDFLDLEAFLALKDTGSFQGAAARLNLSQSSITRRIQKLEEALGTQLFERTTRDVKPTLAAKRFQARAEAILQDVHEAARSMRDETAAFQHQRLQTLTLATIPTVMSVLVAPAMHAFRANGAHARLRLMDMAANEVAEAVSGGEADIGICSLPMLEPTTEFQPFFNEPIGLALRADHPLAQQGTVAWSDLQEDALIVPAQGTGNRLLIDEALARTHKRLRWTYEVSRTSTALDLVASGLGLALVPRSAAMSLAGGGLAWMRIPDIDVERPIGLLSRTGRVDSRAVAAFKGALLGVVARLKAG